MMYEKHHCCQMGEQHGHCSGLEWGVFYMVIGIYRHRGPVNSPVKASEPLRGGVILGRKIAFLKSRYVFLGFRFLSEG